MNKEVQTFSDKVAAIFIQKGIDVNHLALFRVYQPPFRYYE